jgi:hypothetical protein
VHLFGRRRSCGCWRIKRRLSRRRLPERYGMCSRSGRCRGWRQRALRADSKRVPWRSELRVHGKLCVHVWRRSTAGNMQLSERPDFLRQRHSLNDRGLVGTLDDELAPARGEGRLKAGGKALYPRRVPIVKLRHDSAISSRSHSVESFDAVPFDLTGATRPCITAEMTEMNGMIDQSRYQRR